MAQRRRRRRYKVLPGYTKLPGKSRRYRTPTGETISRRQYENIRLKGQGFSSWSELQRAKPIEPNVRKEDYVRWLRRASHVHKKPVSELRKSDSRFNYLLAKAADDDFEKSADGTFHDFLVYLGYRNPGDDFPPGDS